MVLHELLHLLLGNETVAIGIHFIEFLFHVFFQLFLLLQNSCVHLFGRDDSVIIGIDLVEHALGTLQGSGVLFFEVGKEFCFGDLTVAIAVQLRESRGHLLLQGCLTLCNESRPFIPGNETVTICIDGIPSLFLL